MSDRFLSRLAWIITGGGLLLLALAMLLTLAQAAAEPLPGEPLWYDNLLITVSLSAAIIVGGFVAARLPRNPYGWLLLAFGISNGAIQGFAANYIIYSYHVAPRPLPLTAPAFFFVALGFATWISAIPLLFLLFPNGRLPSRRWRLFAALIVLCYIAMVATLWLSETAQFVPFPSPLHRSDTIGLWAGTIGSVALSLTLFLAMPVSGLSVVFRAIRARGLERQQFKWLGLASLLLALAIFFNSELVPLLPSTLDALLEAIAYAGVPLAVGIAVLRYRLWDIDLIIRKTALYSVVTMLLAIVYVVLVIVLQTVFTRVTAADSTPAVVVSTLSIAALFSPLRRWVQTFIDRRFYRRKYDAAQVLNRFAQTARDETDLDKLTAELLNVIRETMEPEQVSIWLRPAERRALPDEG